MVQTILLALMFMKLNSAKLLTATYESEFKTDSAWLYLQQIPDDNAENTAFKELYTQLLNGINPPAGSGKAMGIQEGILFLRQSALQEQMTYAPIAQAINASYLGEIYYKNVKIQRGNLYSIEQNGKKLLSLYPNPASKAVTFRVSETNSRHWLIITDMYGKKIQTVNLLSANTQFNTENLPAGIFFCTLLNQNMEIVETHKLIVAH